MGSQGSVFAVSSCGKVTAGTKSELPLKLHPFSIRDCLGFSLRKVVIWRLLESLGAALTMGPHTEDTMPSPLATRP